MASSVKGFNVKIGADTSGLQEALKELSKSSKTLNQELKYINKYLNLDSSNTKLEAERMRDLEREVENSKKAIQALNVAKEQLQQIEKENGGLNEEQKEQLRSINIEIEAQKVKIKELTAEMSKWTAKAKELQEVGKSIKAIGDKLSEVGFAFTTYLTLPIAGAATAAINAAKDFESAFTGVTKTVDETVNTSFEDLKQGIMDLSLELPATTTEISNVAEAAGQLGIGADSVLEFTKVMLQLGVSTNLSANDAATALAKFANITGTATTDYSRLGSVLVELGNNFATTESDILDMSTRLAATGHLVGLTEPQIMALSTAMSSVGIEAEAGGSAMSKLLKKIQIAVSTGSNDLKQFASVAGVSAKEFKKKFQTDAVGALDMFIQGLNDTKRNGKDAVGILADMELNEVRLSNTILSLAGGHDLLSRAVKSATKEWENNNALAKEAEKRYATFESQVQITKNQLNKLGVEIGNRLIPYVQKALEWVSKMVDKWDDLSDSEKDNILKMTAIVAAAGPLLMIFGKITSLVGSGVISFGKLAEQLVKAKAGLSVTNDAFGAMAKLLVSLNPTALAVAAALGVVAGILVKTYEATHQAEIESREIGKTLDKETKSWSDLSAAAQDYYSKNSGEISNLQYLRDELYKVVDANGKVKQGYEERAEYILGKLKEATGQEYELIDGQITKYDELKDAINKVIIQKQAELTLEANSEKVLTARSKVTEATDKLAASYSKMQQEQAEVDRLDALINEQMEKGVLVSDVLTSSREKHNEALLKEQSNYQKAMSLISEYGNTVTYYEQLEAAMMTGSAEEISEALNKFDFAVGNTTINLKDSYAEQLLAQNELVEQQKSLLENENLNLSETVRQEIETRKSGLEDQRKAIEDNFLENAKTLTTLGQNEIEAFKWIALNDSSAYNQNIGLMAPEVQKQLQSITQGINDNTPIQARFATIMGERTKTSYEQEIEPMDKITSIKMELINQTIVDNTPIIQGTTENLGNTVTTTLDDTADGYGPAQDFMMGIERGLSAGEGPIYAHIMRIGNQMVASLMASLNEHSPSKLSQEAAEFFDLGIVEGIENKSNLVENAVKKLGGTMVNSLDTSVFDSNMGDINAKVINGSKTVFTTPNIQFNVQKMNEENLNACFNFINKKFGSAY